MRHTRYPTEQEWAEIVALGPGVRMYNGLRTLFYNGEILRDVAAREFLIYDYAERLKWEVIIILPGVEVIPDWTLSHCIVAKVVIMADTVRRVEHHAFHHCPELVFIRLSRNLEYIGLVAFARCESLTSIFIPQSCVEIDFEAFWKCKRLITFSVPQHTRLGRSVIHETALKNVSPFKEDGQFPSRERNDALNTWLRNGNINIGQEYSLHRAFSSFNPLPEIIVQVLKRQGLKALRTKNSIGITPFQYLESNPFAEVDQKNIVNRYILEMMGETI
ncbi:hypothetical protein CTEN210_18443 [Chaetoceros tenuissimus]|uniref:Uncharacterized protein n=1 Tax=Chaetoceros tenuissimus TaxID=426638 RepID=A0AAD3HFG1_9STRA|nr:hypothetical protein CTEN210_18443 [Chaetoceros tenuissimus]